MTTENPPNQQAFSGAMMAGIAALGGGAILAAAALFGFQKGVLLILLGAVLLVLLVLVIFRLVLKWRAARRSAPFTQTVERAAGDTPNAISSPGSRAKLDDLRRTFETGLSRFRAAGKDLYKLPWYLLVGEPGSGKTEAIRHSSIPFPPGLQDQLQGSGGTVNMNWWFTNDAVILDTAGRYIFNEVQAGASNEWTEFLRLLLRNRPECPVNGLLLVIPANSLILDTADQIEAKGGQIAQQLDRIQRTLEVRFPVYIVVTKCDLVNGFREFFDGLNDPRLQHQILGWSNPAPLDQAFNPELVDEHLKSVAAKLSQRRLGLLLDPIARESEQSRRIDEVDSLYSLPESFLRLGPRLRRYLEMIFVAGEWSPKPLFLRGIYFTSSMREGQAIDAELMELLRVPAQSLREGKLWERDRAFFLRDLFLKKVFPEKGLVTRAASTAKLQRTRSVAILGGGCIAAILLLAFTWFGNAKLKQSIVNQGTFWQGLADQSDTANLAIVAPASARPTTAPSFRSRLDDPLPKAQDGSARTVGDMYRDLFKYEQSPIYVHPVLLPAAKLLNSGGNLNQKKSDDYRAIYLANVLTPLLDAAGRKLDAQDPAAWDPSATTALIQLVHSRAGTAIALDPLLRYVIPDAAASEPFRDRDAPGLEKGLALVQPQGKPPLEAPLAVVEAGVERFIQHWDYRLGQSSDPFKALTSPSGPADGASKGLAAIDADCVAACKSPPLTTDAYGSQVKSWRAALGQYTDACKALDQRLADLSAGASDATLASLYSTRNSQAQAEAKAQYDALLAEFPPPAPDAANGQSPDAAQKGLAELRLKLQRSRDNLKNGVDAALVGDLQKLDDSLLKIAHAADGQPIRSYNVMGRMYQTADAQLPAPEALAGTPAASADADAKLKSAREGIDGLAKLLPGDPATATSYKDANIVLSSLAEPADRYQSVARQLIKAPATTDAIQSAVADLASSDPVKYAPVALPSVPFIIWPAAQPGFHPVAAADYLTSLKPLLAQATVQPSQGAGSGDCAPTTILNAAELAAASQRCRDGVAAYLGDYARHWNAVIEQQPAFRSKDAAGGNPRNMDWADLRQKLPLGATSVDNGFGQLAQLMLAVTQVPAAVKGSVSSPDPAAFDRILAETHAAQVVLKSAEDKPSADPYSNALRLWQDLGDDPAAARSQVLARTARQFADSYMLFGLEETDFVTRYWRAVAGALLDSLVRAPDPAADSVSAWRSKHHAFPIGPTTSDLTPKDLDELRASLKGVLLPSKSTGKPDETLLAGGRLPGNGRGDVNALNSQFDKLANGSLAPADQEQFRRLSQFLDALPPAGEQWPCGLSVPNADKQNDLRTRYSAGLPSAQRQWPAGTLRLEIDQKPAGGKPIGFAKGGDLGEAQYPGDPIRLALFAYPSDANPDQFLPPPPAKGGVAPGRWECLRLLTGNAHASPDDPTLFYVELTPVFKGEKYSLWVTLKFKKALAEYSSDAWPK
jgi:hypothetical protein